MSRNYLHNTCLVAPPFKSKVVGTGIRRYNEVFLPAIQDAGHVADTFAFDSVIGEGIYERIAAAQNCFADISDADPRVWFILGSAGALHKPSCVVISDTALEAIHANSEFSVLGFFPQLITYPEHALPSDYTALRTKITTLLLESAPNQSRIETVEAARVSVDLAAVSQSPSKIPGDLVPSQTTTGATAPADNIDSTGDQPVLKNYEEIALHLIAQHQVDKGIGLGKLAQEMHKLGLVQATSLAVNALKHRQFIKRYSIPATGRGSRIAAAGVSITQAGQQWLEKHPQPVSEPLLEFKPFMEPRTLIDFLATLRFRH